MLGRVVALRLKVGPRPQSLHVRAVPVSAVTSTASRLLQHAKPLEDTHRLRCGWLADQQSSDAAIPIEVSVDGLELHMHQ